MATWQWIVVTAGTILSITTTLRGVCRALIVVIKQWALTTETKADDEWIDNKLSPRVELVLNALDILRRALPAVVLGPWPSTQPLAGKVGLTSPSGTWRPLHRCDLSACAR